MKNISQGTIFRNYDIRGIYPSEINSDLFYNVGLIVGRNGFNKLAVGRDARLSSSELFGSFTKGLLDSGAEVINLGMLTSPMLSLFCVVHKMKGAMITASHNPKEYNGIKFIDKDGQQLGYDRFLKKIETLIRKQEEIRPFKKGTIKNSRFSGDYVRYLIGKFDKKLLNSKKIVIDCSNGVGGIALSKLRRKGFHFILINKRPDGNFPNHGSDQTKPENFKQLQKEVLRRNADIGIILDGDGDRCAFVDEKGRIVPPDVSFLILALEELKKSRIKNPKILFNLTFSKAVSEYLHKNGAKPLALRVGNPYYKSYLKKDRNAILAGEYSGHIMYRDNHGIDDGTYAGLKMVSTLIDSNKPLSELVDLYKIYYNTGQLAAKARDPSSIIKFFKAKFSKYKESMLDGVSVDMGDVWFNIRPSNTEPLVRFIVEGKSDKKVEKIKREIIELIKKHQ
jgi:phosphomannomutase